MRRAHWFKYLNFFPLSLKGGFFFRCGGLSELENKGVLLSRIGRRGKEFFFSRSYFLGGVGWLGKKGEYSLSLPFVFLSHNMVT